METSVELEKTDNPVLTREKLYTDEVYKMTEVSVLPEESGWELIEGDIIRHLTDGIFLKFGKLLESSINEKSESDNAMLKMRDDFYTASRPKKSDMLLEISLSMFDDNGETNKGIVEFWLANLENGTIETYSKPKNGNYFEMKIYNCNDVIYYKHIENLKLKVAEIIPEIIK